MFIKTITTGFAWTIGIGAGLIGVYVGARASDDIYNKVTGNRWVVKAEDRPAYAKFLENKHKRISEKQAA